MKCTFCRLAMLEMHTLIYCLLIDWRAGAIQALVHIAMSLLLSYLPIFYVLYRVWVVLATSIYRHSLSCKRRYFKLYNHNPILKAYTNLSQVKIITTVQTLYV